MAESFAGITVPEGEPAEVEAAAATFAGVAGGLSGAGAELQGMPGTLASWRGPASISYGSSCLTNGSAIGAAEEALQMCSQVARSYALARAEAKREARQAIDEAREATRRIERAEAEIADAEAAGAAAASRAASASVEVMTTGLTGAPSAGAMADLDAARADADAAAARAARARRELEAAEEDLREAQERGRRAEEAAEDAARTAAGQFQGLAASSPAAVYAGQVAQARAAAQAQARAQAEAEEPGFLERAWEGALSSFGRGTPLDPLLSVGEAVSPGFRADFAQGAIVDPVVGLGELGWMGIQLSPTYGRIDPAGQQERREQLAETGEYIWNNPGEAGKSLIGWDYVENGEPGRFVGGLFTDGALTLAGGVGVAGRAARTGDKLSDLGEVGRDAERLEDAATAGRAVEPGSWIRKNEGMGEFSRRYEEFNGGRAGETYRVETPDGRTVDFDGYQDGTLIESKGRYDHLFESSGEPKPFYNAKEDLLGQARRQVEASGGRPIEWRFAERGPAYEWVRREIRAAELPIRVRHVPMSE